MITLIGVGHVFAITDNVKSIIRQRRPQVVCLELDAARYSSLVNKERSGSVPLQYRLLALFQDRLADKFETEVGGEMLAAAGAAQEVGAKLALIDMDAAAVFGRMWKKMSMKEKVHLLGGAFVGLFVSKKTVERELDRYEGNEAAYIESMGAEFPTIKEVLIDDRNSFMADRLISLSAENANIVAVVGDGHVPGIMARLTGMEIESVRLKDLRSGVMASSDGATASASYSYRLGP